MQPEDAEGLYGVFGDARLYEQGYLMARRLESLTEAQQLVAAALATRPGRTPYTVRLVADTPLGPAGTVVGTSSLSDVELANEAVHLGWTAYGPQWWGTAVNPATKLLMLGHAFQDCGFGRVRIQTDLLNERSQAAIARLGAVREGVLRRSVRRWDGTFRDTVVYSILSDEWPAVRQGLEDRVRAATAGYGPLPGHRPGTGSGPPAAP